MLSHKPQRRKKKTLASRLGFHGFYSVGGVIAGRGKAYTELRGSQKKRAPSLEKVLATLPSYGAIKNTTINRRGLLTSKREF